MNQNTPWSRACETLTALSHHSQQFSSKQVIDALYLLCKDGAQLYVTIEVPEIPVCVICNEDIQHVAHLVSKTLDCGHEIHRACLRRKMQSLCERQRNRNSMPAVSCTVCQIPLSQALIMQVIGEADFHQSFMVMPRVRQPSPEPIRPPPRPVRPTETVQPLVDCVRCKTKHAANTLITFECDHRYCLQCLKTLAQQLISRGVNNFSEMVCLQCHNPLDEYILRSSLSPLIYEQIKMLRDLRLRLNVQLGLI